MCHVKDSQQCINIGEEVTTNKTSNVHLWTEVAGFVNCHIHSFARCCFVLGCSRSQHFLPYEKQRNTHYTVLRFLPLLTVTCSVQMLLLTAVTNDTHFKFPLHYSHMAREFTPVNSKAKLGNIGCYVIWLHSLS